jgi:hypothetical protein
MNVRAGQSIKAIVLTKATARLFYKRAVYFDNMARRIEQSLPVSESGAGAASEMSNNPP